MTGILPDANETVKIRIQTILQNAEDTHKSVEELAKLFQAVAKEAKVSLDVAASAVRDLGIYIESDITKALSLAKAFDKLAGSKNSLLAKSPAFIDRTAKEQESLLIQEKKLALENAELQVYKSQLAELEKMKAVDAARLDPALPQNRDYAIPVNGEQASLATRKIQEAEEGLTKTTRPLTQAQQELGQALEQMGKKSGQAGKGLWSLTNLARTAIGTFEAMAIFFLTQLVGNAIKKTIDSISQLEQALIKLNIAERAISASGVDITPGQLADITKSVADAYDTVSKIDAAKMVSNLAVLTKDLKLTADQYKELALAIPLVAQQAGVSIDSATEQVINGLTKSGKGWADLGITVDAEIIRQRAVSDGIVASADAYNKLTAEQKQQVEVQALINILLDNTNENLAEQENYLNTIEGQTKASSAEWEDLLATLGQISRPTLIQFLKEVTETLKNINDWLESNRDKWAQWSATLAGAASLVGSVMQAMSNPALYANPVYWKKSIEDAKMAYNDALELAQKMEELGKDTPTAPQSKEPPKVDEDLQKALEKMNNEILEAQLKLAQDMEDAAIDLGRKLEDITIEYARKRADAEIDYMSTVASINADYQNTVADIQSDQAQANAEAHADELQREAEFQEQMRQLKERFLMDLEDALHSRDARQVLRLIKQYNMDKENAEREFALQQENAQREQALRNEEFARKRADAERERKAKLDEAQRDYQEKLAKLAADEAAERTAAELAYQRKMQDLEREMQNRLEIVAANLVAEFNLTKDGLDAIVALYKKYYAEVAQIYAAMQSMMAGQANLGGGSTGGSSGKPTGGGSSGGGGGNIKPMAEGGVVFANRPTKAVFGEAGMEMATFTPLGRQGKDVNKIFSNLGGNSGNSSGAIGIEVLLSPDLEGRIVQNTLSQTANVIMKVQRSK